MKSKVKRCKKCGSGMVQTQYSVAKAWKGVLISAVVVPVVIILCAIILNMIDHRLVNLAYPVLAVNAIVCIVRFVAAMSGSYTTYTCPKCGSTKQRVNILETIFEALGEILELIGDII